MLVSESFPISPEWGASLAVRNPRQSGQTKNKPGIASPRTCLDETRVYPGAHHAFRDGSCKRRRLPASGLEREGESNAHKILLVSSKERRPSCAEAVPKVCVRQQILHSAGLFTALGLAPRSVRGGRHPPTDSLRALTAAEAEATMRRCKYASCLALHVQEAKNGFVVHGAPLVPACEEVEVT